MATSTVEKTKGQVGSVRQDKVVMGRESEQQIEEEQWEFDKYVKYGVVCRVYQLYSTNLLCLACERFICLCG